MLCVVEWREISSDAIRHWDYVCLRNYYFPICISSSLGCTAICFPTFSHRVGAQFNFTVHHFDRIYTAIISSLDWFVFHLLFLFLSPTFWQNDSFDDSYFVNFVIFSNLGFRWESLMVLKIELMCSILENNAYSQYAIFSTSRQISWQMIFLLFFLSNSLLFKL